jgi:hypothetical protein
MEHQLWKTIVALLLALDMPRTPTRFDFSDRDIVAVYYWSVLGDRPTSWAGRPASWPPHLRKRRLPSAATLSRRLRSASVRALLGALEQRVLAPAQPGLYWMIDGKPLPIGGCSKDRQAGYGRAAGGQAKGYKLHALVGPGGAVAAWRVAPMNKDERVLAKRLVKAAPPAVVGYLVADANYDSNPLHQVCDARRAATGDTTAVRAGAGDGAADPGRRAAAVDRADGESVRGLRGAAAARPGGERAAVRELDELGRGVDVPAGVGADPPAGAPLGSSQVGPDRTQTPR